MDEPNNFCLCKSTHVLTGAKWIGIVGSLGCALLSFCLCLAGHNLLGLLLCLAAAPFYVSLICAQMRRQPRLYWPFLLANSVKTLLLVFYMVFLLAMLAIMPKFWQRHLALALGNNQLSMAVMRQWTAMLFLGALTLECLLCWFQSVVLSAHNYMCQEKVTLIPPQLSPLFAPNTKKEPRVERESQLA